MNLAVGKTPCCTLLPRPDFMPPATMSWTNMAIFTAHKAETAGRLVGDWFTGGLPFPGMQCCTRSTEPTALIPAGCARTPRVIYTEQPSSEAQQVLEPYSR